MNDSNTPNPDTGSGTNERGRQPSSPRHIASTLLPLQAHWGWFIALGVVLLVLGVLALGYVFVATLASVFFIGMLMSVAGLGQLLHAWRIKQLHGFILWSVSGLFYLAAGVFAVFYPVQGASLLTLLFGSLLIAVGALRTWIWFNNRGQRGWGWLGVSGGLTLFIGLIIAANWPGNSVWVLGLLLAVDLLFQGWSALLLGMFLRQGRN